ncbi:MAG: tetratricopeptide repeat-containing sensor histidine kinase [Bacteroidales bacterium]|nr:tetratricopeptide repeat-containing sensor histidine kinase [Bacteroidales bacterium]
MKRYFSIILLILSSLILNGKDKKLITLDNLLETAAEAEKNMDAKSAAVAYEEAVQLCRDKKDDEHLITSLHSYSIILSYLGEYDKAINTIVECYELSDILEDSREIKAQCYMQLGQIYFFMQNYDEALKNYIKAMNLAEEIENMMGYSIAQNNIANIYQINKDYFKAIELYNKCIKIQEQVNDSATICNCLYNIGTCKYELNLFDEASEALKQANKIATDIKDAEIISLSLIYLAKVEMNEGHFDKALSFINRGIELSQEAGYRQVLLAAYKASININIQAGNYRAASLYGEKALALSDSIFQEESLSQINEFQVKYDTQEKEHKIQLQETELAFNKRILIYLILTLVLFGISIALLVRLIIIQKRRNKELVEINQIKNKFFSIISHDLKNPAIAQKKNLQLLLDNFPDLPDNIRQEQLSLILDSSKQIVELLYNLLDWSRIEVGNIPYHPVNFPLIDAVREAVSVLKIQALDKSITISIEIPEKASAYGDRNMVVTVIRNIISNALKYSYKDSIIHITAQEYNGSCKISVIDTGIGMSQETVDSLFNLSDKKSALGTCGEAGNGLGMIICKEMIEKNGGKVFIESSEGNGSTISFTIKTEHE